MNRGAVRRRVLAAMRRAMMTAYIRIYRRTGGRIGGRGADGTPVLLLTVAGRTTGIPRTVPVGYFQDGGAYLVVGSGGGSKAEPQWSRNLSAASAARIQVGRRTLPVTVERLTPDAQARTWRDVVVARSPAYARLPARAGRTMPIFRLRPTIGAV